MKNLFINKPFVETGHSFNKPKMFKALGVTIGGIGVTFGVLFACISCNKETFKGYNFKYWNDSKSLNTLVDFVKDSVIEGKSTYIPKEDRIATFDMDGTLYGERAPIYVEWLMYHDYLNNVAPTKKTTEVDVDPDGKHTKMTLAQIDAEVVEFMKPERKAPEGLEMHEAYGGAELFSGITIPEYIQYVESFLDKNVDGYFSDLKFKDMFYLPMIEVVEFLQLNNFDVYIVSGTDRFMVRDIVNQHLNIPYNKVIGMDVSLDISTDPTTKKTIVKRGNKLKYKNVEKVKVELIAQEIGKKPVLSFGNSTGDSDMHDYCLSNDKYNTQAYMVNNDDDEREYSNDRSESWKKTNYHVFSMKKEWKTIYGSNVKKIGK